MIEKKNYSRDDILDDLYMFYEAAGFWPDVLEEEFSSMSDEELMKCYADTFAE